MSDLIERLRKGHGYDSYGGKYPTKTDTEAADEIERLTAEVDRIFKDCCELSTALAAIDKPKCQHCAGDTTKPHTNCILRSA